MDCGLLGFGGCGIPLVPGRFEFVVLVADTTGANTSAVFRLEVRGNSAIPAAGSAALVLLAAVLAFIGGFVLNRS